MQVSFTLFLVTQGFKTTGHWPYGVFTHVSCVFFGSPARSRTEVIAFRGHPVLETGVLTVTLLGSILKFQELLD